MSHIRLIESLCILVVSAPAKFEACDEKNVKGVEFFSRTDFFEGAMFPIFTARLLV